MGRWRGGERGPPDHHIALSPPLSPMAATPPRQGMAESLSEWMMRGEREASGFKTPPLKQSSLKKGSFAATNKRAFLDS